MTLENTHLHPEPLVHPRRISIAPMMKWTDRHQRMFIRQITTCATVFTEMVTSKAVIHGYREKLLGFNPAEHPIVLQIGGSDPLEMAEAAQIGEDCGYDEININVGCPSDRVQSGTFGACLMKEPGTVARCVELMRKRVSIPVSIKNRLGVDDQEPEKSLSQFIEITHQAGCETYYVHARKAWLKGLSPKENREKPPLDHNLVYQLKQNYPHLFIALNGGVATMEDAAHHLKHVDGVMIGREAYHNPYCLASVDYDFYYQAPKNLSRVEVMQNYLPYVEHQLTAGVPLHAITRHILGLFYNQWGGNLWRRHLSSNPSSPGATALYQALEHTIPKT